MRIHRTYLLAVGILIPTLVAAEPIHLRVTGGSVEFDWTDIFSGYNLSGPEFDLQLVMSPPDRGIAFDGRLAHPSFDVDGVGSGMLRVRDRAVLVDDGFARARFQFRAPGVPVDADGGLGTLSFPFTFAGVLEGIGSDGEPFSYAFAGRGGGQLFTTEPVAGFDELAARFGLLVFDDSTPVPEPSTLLLLGSAAALTWRRRRHK